MDFLLRAAVVAICVSASAPIGREPTSCLARASSMSGEVGPLVVCVLLPLQHLLLRQRDKRRADACSEGMALFPSASQCRRSFAAQPKKPSSFNATTSADCPTPERRRRVSAAGSSPLESGGTVVPSIWTDRSRRCRCRRLPRSDDGDDRPGVRQIPVVASSRWVATEKAAASSGRMQIVNGTGDLVTEPLGDLHVAFELHLEALEFDLELTVLEAMIQLSHSRAGDRAASTGHPVSRQGVTWHVR